MYRSLIQHFTNIAEEYLKFVGTTVSRSMLQTYIPLHFTIDNSYQ